MQTRTEFLLLSVVAPVELQLRSRMATEVFRSAASSKAHKRLYAQAPGLNYRKVCAYLMQPPDSS